MFDSLVGQQAVSSILAQEITRGELPSALLFAGPAFSGKMTAAFELARALTCQQGQALADCACRDCRAHQLLTHPSLQLLGSADLGERYHAMVERLQRQDSPGLRRQWLQLLRQLLLRFSPLLWQGRSRNEREKKALDAMSLLGESLLEEGIDPRAGLPELSRQVDLACQGLASGSSVSHMRRMQTWAQQSSNQCRVAVITQAETLSEHCSNALLKILEEPPPRLLLILTSRLPRSIPATLRSRLRCYRFFPRSLSEQLHILTHFFDAPEVASLVDFFAPRVQAEEAFWAEHFLESVLQGKTFSELDAKLRELPLPRVLAVVTRLLQQQPQCYALEWRLVWSTCLEYFDLAREYNLSGPLLLRDFYQRMLLAREHSA